jgi:hypothetical protein
MLQGSTICYRSLIQVLYRRPYGSAPNQSTKEESYGGISSQLHNCYPKGSSRPR